MMILPEGLEYVATRVPLPEDQWMIHCTRPVDGPGGFILNIPDFEHGTWLGGIRMVRRDTGPHVIVKASTGYEIIYDIRTYDWVCLKDPGPFPKGDWLALAFPRVLAELADVNISYFPTQKRPGESVLVDDAILKFSFAKQRLSVANGLVFPKTADVKGELDRQIGLIASSLKESKGQIVTVDLELPGGVEYARREERNGLSMRCVVAKGDGKWFIRVDVLFAVKPSIGVAA